MVCLNRSELAGALKQTLLVYLASILAGAHNRRCRLSRLDRTSGSACPFAVLLLSAPQRPGNRSAPALVLLLCAPAPALALAPAFALAPALALRTALGTALGTGIAGAVGVA